MSAIRVGDALARLWEVLVRRIDRPLFAIVMAIVGVGFVTLFGITTRNSIMMLSHFDHLVNREGAAWNLETMLRGAGERFGPIVMTGLVTGLGLLPLALQSGAAGREIEGPMAIVIVGGLATSTILNLFVLPSLALRFGRFERASAEDEA